MAFLYLIGSLALLLYLQERLIALPWWATVGGLAVVAVAVVYVQHLAVLEAPGAVFFALLVHSLQSGLAEYMAAARVQVLQRKVGRGLPPLR